MTRGEGGASAPLARTLLAVSAHDGAVYITFYDQLGDRLATKRLSRSAAILHATKVLQEAIHVTPLKGP